MALHVAFTGARYWTDVEVVVRELELLPRDAVIIHGGQGGWKNGILTGVDAIVDLYARGMLFEVRKFPAKWKAYGEPAGPMRNAVMVQELTKAKREGHETHVIAIHDDLDRSKGTASMVRLSRLAGHPVKLVEG